MKDMTICADAMAGLLQSLAKDVPKIYLKARVNGVAPGAVDTTRFKDECERYGPQWEYEECEATVGMAKPVPPEDVAKTCLFLASEKWSGSTHGQLLHVGKLIAEAMVVGCLLTIFEMAARWEVWSGSRENLGRYYIIAKTPRPAIYRTITLEIRDRHPCSFRYT